MSSAMLARCGSSSDSSAPDLPVLLERERRAEQLRRALDESEALALGNDLGRDLLAVVLLQLRLVIEQVELRRRAGHEQIDDVLGLWREVRRPDGRMVPSRPGLREKPLVQQRRQRQAPIPKPDCLKKCRRVIARSTSVIRLRSLFGEDLVEVQERVRDEGPGGLFRRHRSRRRRSPRSSGRLRPNPSGIDRADARRTPRCDRAPRLRGPRQGEAERIGCASRQRRLPALSRSVRAASARAASKYASSFSVVSACSGVFVRTRRTVQRSRLVASNVRKLG